MEQDEGGTGTRSGETAIGPIGGVSAPDLVPLQCVDWTGIVDGKIMETWNNFVQPVYLAWP